MISRRLSSATPFGLVLSALACTVVSATGQAADRTSFWVNEPISVDGNAADWDSIPTIFFDDEDIVIGVCNDSTNVYVLFRFRDVRWLRGIRMTGLTLWLDANGKEKEDFGVRYAGGPSFAELMELMEPGEEDIPFDTRPGMRDRMESRMSAREDSLKVIYKGKEQPDAIPTDGSAGPAVGYGSSETLFTYEFAVPLQTSDYATFGMAAEPNQKISIGFEWGGLKRGDRRGMAGMQPGEFGGGGHGGPPGGGRMGGGKRGRGQMEPPEEHKFWVKTILAKPDNQ